MAVEVGHASMSASFVDFFGIEGSDLWDQIVHVRVEGVETMTR